MLKQHILFELPDNVRKTEDDKRATWQRKDSLL